MKDQAHGNSLAIAYAVKRRAKKMADGGMVKDKSPSIDQKAAEDFSRGAQQSGPGLKQMYENLKHSFDSDDSEKKMAQGGMVMNKKLHPGHVSMGGPADIVKRVMAKRMAKGGMVEQGDMDEMDMDGIDDGADSMLRDPDETDQFGAQTYPDEDNTEHPVMDEEDPMTRRKKMIRKIVSQVE